jgi:hypothetical protein
LIRQQGILELGKFQIPNRRYQASTSLNSVSVIEYSGCALKTAEVYLEFGAWDLVLCSGSSKLSVEPEAMLFR